ncbi:MAG: bifunctional UDP-N-acetylglucosamine diphosphorylase/glucosamine-1-phosphate N-acetyltransferase GlmU [Candidatus Carbobacillus altaicus]|uniref:Bifunctional protein GlmU n=1 Tax=Candidatus Carbonibacillus altaicus TaxID=2163959 RepID=A0A2R6Y1N7_9BACL|nr:bifunctional UDP-N-acetylglucosamine diphosphorylase/glucosamine-1-phosphate N-acetyltransferase GlmU [Candidatus Carbobacillus altaicus]PTQ56583.1 MAG: N-acetylglucosamine-1-phosphate uridyltransferase [Candidatus Carbobacillus altaicus]
MQQIAFVLAAGKGTRMRSEKPKVLHPLLGEPMLGYVLENIEKAAAQEVLLVLGYGRERIMPFYGERATIVIQEEQRGTGHAARVALDYLKHRGDRLEEIEILIVHGDTPLVSSTSLTRLHQAFKQNKSQAALLTAHVERPFGLGRVLRDAEGRVQKIVEEKDATDVERQIKEINVGVYLFEARYLEWALGQLSTDNAQGEYYLTDVIHLILTAGGNVTSVAAVDPDEALSINDRAELAVAEEALRRRILAYHMRQGVTIEMPDTVRIGPYVEIEPDVVIRPGTILMGATRIGKEAVIGPYSELKDVIVGDGALVRQTVAEAARIDDGATIGPFAYLRPGAQIGRGVRIGNFVEVKNSTIGEGSKVPHLAYVGDAIIGREVNMSCGTITVNYDGLEKHTTVIGDRAFIGCNVNLIAPVTIGDGAYVAAGSTIDQPVPRGALAIARARQMNKEDYVEAWLARKKEKRLGQKERVNKGTDFEHTSMDAPSSSSQHKKGTDDAQLS